MAIASLCFFLLAFPASEMALTSDDWSMITATASKMVVVKRVLEGISKFAGNPVGKSQNHKSPDVALNSTQGCVQLAIFSVSCPRLPKPGMLQFGS